MPQETGAGQNENTLALRGLTPVIVHTATMHERKHIRVACTIANRKLKRIQNSITLTIPDLRLTAVEPEPIPPFREFDPHQVLPVILPCRRIGGVIDVSPRDEQSQSFHLLVVV